MKAAVFGQDSATQLRHRTSVCLSVCVGGFMCVFVTVFMPERVTVQPCEEGSRFIAQGRLPDIRDL